MLCLYSSASLDEGSSAASVLSGQVQTLFVSHSLCDVFSLEDAENDFNFFCLLLQPSSSCSFDGSLKTDQSDSEPKWPEVPPVLNQNEDRRRNKYLRKDYLKVRVAHEPPERQQSNLWVVKWQRNKTR